MHLSPLLLALLQQPAVPSLPPSPVVKVEITPAGGEIQIGQTLKLSARALDAGGQPVANAVARVTIEPAATSVRTGDVVRLTVTAKDAAGRPIPGVTAAWSLEAGSGAADLDPDGAFVAELPGTYTVTAAFGTRTADAVVNVEPRRVTRGMEVRAHLPIKFSTAEVWVHPSGACAYLSTIADRVYAIDIADPTHPKIVD